MTDAPSLPDPALRSWTTRLPGSSVTLTFRRADAERDASLLHSWMHRPHVVPWWLMDRPLAEIHDYLAGLTHLSPWVVAADGVPFGYV